MRGRRLLLFPCALLATVCAVRAQAPDDPLARAVQYEQQGNLSAAEAEFHRALAAQPRNYAAHHNLGLMLTLQHRWPEAVSEFRKALEAEPTAIQPRQNIVTTLLDAGEHDAAVYEATRLVRASDTPSSHLLLGRAYLANGDGTDGCREMQRALAFNSLNSLIELQLAACYASTRDFEPARLHADAVLRREPNNRAAREVVRSVRREQATTLLIGLSFLVALGGGIGAIAARGPDRWGHRRVALGCVAVAVSWMLALGTTESFWYSGGFWGIYQFYAAYRHRRMRSQQVDDRVLLATAAARVLAVIALSDGEMHPSELRIVRETYERSGGGEGLLSAMGDEMRKCQRDFEATLFDHDALYGTLRDACVDFGKLSNDALRLQLFGTAVAVGLAEGPPTPNTLRALSACATWLHVPKESQQALFQERCAT